MNTFLTLDLMPLLAAVLSALCCGLLGNFLVLRRLSLMGDAISHAVLPGIAAAFVITQSRSPVAMLIGAGVAALLTVLIVEIVKRLGRVEPGAAMGVTFSVLFALGVVMIERAARSVDLDADCVLYGQLETLASFGASGDAIQVPRQVITLVIVTLIALAFVGVLFKELRISAFDPGLSTSVGISAGLMHTLLMALVAAAAVASFEAVGSILVIAMLIAPAATARMLTDRLRPQIVVSLIAAIIASVGGYFLAAHAESLGFKRPRRRRHDHRHLRAALHARRRRLP
ncbi:MAG: metal ABC transporter permease [Phycisphaerales bacterium]